VDITAGLIRGRMVSPWCIRRRRCRAILISMCRAGWAIITTQVNHRATGLLIRPSLADTRIPVLVNGLGSTEAEHSSHGVMMGLRLATVAGAEGGAWNGHYLCQCLVFVSHLVISCHWSWLLHSTVLNRNAEQKFYRRPMSPSAKLEERCSVAMFHLLSSSDITLNTRAEIKEERRD
jgi:hypothetical protein